MAEKMIKSIFFNRLGDMGVPILSWLIITFPIWFSPFHPAMVAYFIICFDLYFLYKSLFTAYYATISYLKIHAYEKIPFNKKVASLKRSVQIKHFIVIPNYKEHLHKIESTIDMIVNGDYPHKNLYLALAFEQREEDSLSKAEHLQKKYGYFFKDILVSYHILLEHEAEGKASNQTFACQLLNKYAQKNKFDDRDVMVTICDADSNLPKNYFSYATYEYLKDKDSDYHFYWAPVLLYNNFLKLPFFVRMQATLSSLLRLAFLSQPRNLIQISTYTTNLWLLKQVGFWDVDIIPEDWHIYFQAFFTFGEKVKTIPLFTIINGDAVDSGSLIKTLRSRYEQEKRWAWGVSDIGYAWRRLFTSPNIPWWPKIKKVLFLSETHLMWPISFFILTISASIPPLINPVFKRTVMGFLLPQLSGFILTLASLMIILYVYLDIQIRKKVNIRTKPIVVPFLLIQWYLLPAISFILSSLPALEAHTRLLLGKKITYKVTEKV